MFLLIHHSIRKFEINMRKIILFVVLSFILLMVCCNRVTEKDILGVYAEKHLFLKIQYGFFLMENLDRRHTTEMEVSFMMLSHIGILKME